MEMTVPLSQIPAKKKKKKKLKSKSEPAVLTQDAIDDMTQTDEARRADEATQTGDEDEAKRSHSHPKMRKKRRGPRPGDSIPDVEEGESPEMVVDEEEDDLTPDYSHIPDEGRILGITVHKTDKLKTNHHMSHPMVRVHIVDLDTGHYLKKQTR